MRRLSCISVSFVSFRSSHSRERRVTSDRVVKRISQNCTRIGPLPISRGPSSRRYLNDALDQVREIILAQSERDEKWPEECSTTTVVSYVTTLPSRVQAFPYTGISVKK